MTCDKFHFFGCRADDYLKFVEIQDKEMEDFVAEKEKLFQAHEDNLAAMRRRHWEEEVQMEKTFDEQLAELMEKYSPSSPETKSWWCHECLRKRLHSRKDRIEIVLCGRPQIKAFYENGNSKVQCLLWFSLS